MDNLMDPSPSIHFRDCVKLHILSQVMQPITGHCMNAITGAPRPYVSDELPYSQ